MPYNRAQGGGPEVVGANYIRPVPPYHTPPSVQRGGHCNFPFDVEGVARIRDGIVERISPFPIPPFIPTPFLLPRLAPYVAIHPFFKRQVGI